MARPRNDTPLRITQIRQIPCEDVGAVYNQVLRRILGLPAKRLDANAAEQPIQREKPKPGGTSGNESI
jgi:hypothetical protein